MLLPEETTSIITRIPARTLQIISGIEVQKEQEFHVTLTGPGTSNTNMVRQSGIIIQIQQIHLSVAVEITACILRSVLNYVQNSFFVFTAEFAVWNRSSERTGISCDLNRSGHF